MTKITLMGRDHSLLTAHPFMKVSGERKLVVTIFEGVIQRSTAPAAIQSRMIWISSCASLPLGGMIVPKL